MSRWPVAHVLRLALLLAAADPAAAQDPGVIETAAYREAMARVAEALETGDVALARTLAGDLRDRTVVEGSLRYATDSSVLAPLSRAADAAAARVLLPRVRAVVTSLSGAAPAAAAAAVDRARLDALRREQAPAALRKGGAVSLGPAESLTFSERVLDAAGTFARWVDDLFDALARFLRKLWPRERSREGTTGARPVTVAIVAVAAALLGLLAFRALRRRGGGPLELTSGPAPEASRRDEDPLSREDTEWERYARELEAAGRTREAIRAWYHALLVTLFRRGTLHYQKGRTNWEYAAQLPPEAAWRPDFMAVTRQFDREWYGRLSSDPEVLRDYARTVRRVLGTVRDAPAVP